MEADRIQNVLKLVDMVDLIVLFFFLALGLLSVALLIYYLIKKIQKEKNERFEKRDN